MSSFFTKFTATQQKDRCGLQLKGKEFNVDTARVRSLVGSRCIAQGTQLGTLNDLDGGMGEEERLQEEIHVYIWLVHVVV